MSGIPPTGTVYRAQVPMYYRVVGIPRPGADTAETAPLVTAGTYEGTTVGFTNDYGAGTSCTGTGGPDRVYQIVVPAGQRLTVVATPAAGYDLSLNLMVSLGAPRVCVSGADRYLAGMAETLVYNNGSGAEVLMYAVVGGYNVNQAGSYSITFTLETTPPGDLLENATVIGAGNTSGTTVGYANDYDAGTGCAGTAGPDRVYVTTVPAGKKLTAVLTPQANYNIALNLMRGPGATRTCVSGADSMGAGGAETATYNNGSAAGVPIFLVVESATVGATGTFTLDLSLADMLPGETIENAIPITAGSYAETTVGYANDYGPGTSCAGTAGPDRVYQITVPSGKRLLVNVTPGTGYNVSVNLEAGDTTPRVCLAGSDSAASGVAELASWGNWGSNEVAVYIVVGTASASGAGSYVLNTSFADFVAGDIVENAPLVVAGTYEETLAGYYNDYGSGTGCASSAGPDRVYQVVVPAGERINALVTPSGSWDVSINLMAGPGVPRVCLAGADGRGVGGMELLIYTNISGSETTMFLVVESYSQTVGTYTLELSLGDPVGETCGNAPLTGPGSYAGTLVGYVNDYGSGTGCASGAGPDRVYRVVVPAGERINALVTPSGSWDASINLMAGPDLPRVCVAGANTRGTGGMEILIYTNTSGSETTMFLVVESSSQTIGTYALELTLGAPAGESCDNAPLTGPGTYAGTLVGYVNDYGSGTGCASSAGPDRVYQVVVPAGQRINALVTPSGAWDVSINLMSGPDLPRVCVAGADAQSTGWMEVLIYTNSSGSDTTVYLVVESFSQTVGTYTLELSLGTPPGETCGNALPVEAGVLTGLSAVGYLNDYTPSGCLSSQPGADRVFSVTVPAGQLLTASVMPSTAFSGDPSIYLVAVCGASPLACLDGDDEGSSQTLNTVSYRNTGPSSQTIYIVVDSYSASTTLSSFQLTVGLSP